MSFSPRCNSAFEIARWCAVLATCATARAGEISAEVKDTRGAPVADAVVSATPLSGKPPKRPQPAVIAHQNLQFVPFVTAVQAGTLINLPNRDKVKHHAYSVSSAKNFDLPLYAGTPEAPLLFDKPGIVKIGCNIHDWMKAYVCVVETPFFAVTGADGRAQLRGLPPGAYRVEAWQPPFKGQPSQQQTTVSGAPARVAFALDIKRVFQPGPNPAPGDATYR